MSRLNAIFLAATLGLGWLAPGIASGSNLVVNPDGKIIVHGQVIINDGNLVLDPTSELEMDVAGQITATEVGYDGTLTITDTNGAAVGGAEFQLFVATTYSGSFTTEILPTLGAGYAWINTLTTDGTIAVSDGGPEAVTLAASQIKTTSAQLNGTVQPNGLATDHQFEYGLDNTYGSTLVIESLPASYDTQAVSSVITDLLPKTTYHYQLSATNSLGTSLGQDVTFTTAMIPEIYNTAIDLLPVHQIHMSGRGDPGVTYEIQTSINLIQWDIYEYGTADSSGEFEFTYPTSSGTPKRFFRLPYD
jgi:hypothetical protein